MTKKRIHHNWIRLVLGIALSVSALIGSLHTTIFSNLILEEDLLHIFIVCFICFLRDQIFTKMVVRPFQLPNAIERGFTRVMLAVIPGIAEWLYLTKRGFLYNPKNNTKRKRFFMNNARMEISLSVWACALALVISSFKFTPTPRLIMLCLATLLLSSRIRKAAARCQVHQSKIGKVLSFLSHLLLPIGEHKDFSALIDDIDEDSL